MYIMHTLMLVSVSRSLIGKASFDNVPGSTITDVLTAVSRGEQREDDTSAYAIINYNKMRVGTLRKMLY